ncbi:MAG: C4-dicarboxylate transporter, DctM subunit [Betaproteobacteria bacterium]|jgi:tripartite ATP-independent transporter DctM subunit|nr:C4-dicarboxylate transporter, DctM subunit [Betaproteobacteria bacterium]
MMTAVALGAALVLGFLGVPIGAAFIAGAVLAAGIVAPQMLFVFPTVILRPFDNFTLLAVPLFIIAAEFILFSGVGTTLITGAARLAGARMLPATVVGIGVFFAGITGSSAAETSALGRLLMPLMESKGFKRADIGGLIAVTGGLGILIPPSIPMILYGLITSTSISALFLAGLIPGLVCAAFLAIVGVLTLRPDPARARAAAPIALDKSRGKTGLRLVLTIALPVMMLWGIYGGYGTPTEIAAVVAAYGAILMIGLEPRGWIANMMRASQSTADATSALFLILVGTSLIGYIATNEAVPQRVAEWLAAQNMKPWEFLIWVNVLMLFLGCLLDGLSMMLLVVPLLFPATQALGIHPVHFGILIVVNIEIGAITPPVGLNLFAISAVSNVQMGPLVRATLRYYPAMLALLLLVTFVPWITVGAWGR